MARVTVEDCLARIPNRFALTVLASRRARALCEGRGTAMVECANKQAVTSLREVADGRVRYVEDVAGVMDAFIKEQRASLRGDDSDNTFLETVAFSTDGDDENEDGDDTVEELTSDLHTLSTKKDKDDDDDDDDSLDSTATASSDDVSDISTDDDSSSASDDDDSDIAETDDIDLDDPDELLASDDLDDADSSDDDGDGESESDSDSEDGEKKKTKKKK